VFKLGTLKSASEESVNETVNTTVNTTVDTTPLEETPKTSKTTETPKSKASLKSSPFGSPLFKSPFGQKKQATAASSAHTTLQKEPEVSPLPSSTAGDYSDGNNNSYNSNSDNSNPDYSNSNNERSYQEDSSVNTNNEDYIPASEHPAYIPFFKQLKTGFPVNMLTKVLLLIIPDLILF
jgi:hypothetical protein